MRLGVTSLNITLLFIIAFFMGRSDWVSGVIFIFTGWFLYSAARDLQNRNKKALQVLAQKGSWLESFLGRENTLLVRLFALLTSILLAIALTVIFKGITVNHGYIPPLLIIFAINYFIVFGISKLTISQDDSQLAEQVHHYAIGLIAILFTALLTNVLLSLILTGKDTLTFVTSTVDFSNFEEHAFARRIESNSMNGISRAFINLYLLMDAFKLAAANQITELAFGAEETASSGKYYLFFFFIFLFNMIKLLPFSIAFTVIVIGAHQRMTAWANWLGPRATRLCARLGMAPTKRKKS